MTDYGVTDTGFVKKPLSAILVDIQDRHRASFGAGIDVAIARELGQVDGNIASLAAELWEIGETAYHADDPEAAAGPVLDNIASLTGTVRLTAKASTVPISVNLNAGITLNAGTLIAFDGRPDIQFTIDNPATNAGGSPATITTDTDGDPLTATCTQTGPIVVPAGSLTVKVSVVSGWNTVTNPVDATPGRDVDTDIQLRQRREDELALRGGSTARAIRADLLDTANHPELTGIRTVDIFTNRGDSVDAKGLPPHSFEVLLDDGDTPTVADVAIVQAIYDTAPDGIATFGSTTANATDENGDLVAVRFSRATLKPVYIIATIVTNGDFPSGGVALVKAAILAYGAALKAGETAYALQIGSVMTTVPGCLDVQALQLDFFGPPTDYGINLTPGIRERCTFDSANITLSVVT